MVMGVRRGGRVKVPFEEKYIPEPMSGCWLWIGALDKLGYGKTTGKDGVTRRAPRVAYELYVGKIPLGLVVRHRCDTRSCVNPDHLEIGTQRDNVLDSVRRGGHYEARKTHCDYGHELASKKPGDRQRRCRLCRTGGSA